MYFLKTNFPALADVVVKESGESSRGAKQCFG